MLEKKFRGKKTIVISLGFTKSPQHCWMFPPACTKSWLNAINPYFLTHDAGLTQYECAWSYETFIVMETVKHVSWGQKLKRLRQICKNYDIYRTQ